MDASKAIKIHDNAMMTVEGNKATIEINLNGTLTMSQSGLSQVLLNLGRHGVNLPGGWYLQATMGKYNPR